MKTVTIIFPVFNEETTIGEVVEAAINSGLFKEEEVIVVDDGSSDSSAKIAEDAGAQIIRIQPNQGKANAMREGILRATSDIVLYWDSDLIGCSAHHFQQVIEPILNGRADMCIGVLRSFGQLVAPDWSGQRALPIFHMREFFKCYPNIQRFSVEQKLTSWAKQKNLTIVYQSLTDIRHRQKEEKRGFFIGAWDRLKMYFEIIFGR